MGDTGDSTGNSAILVRSFSEPGANPESIIHFQASLQLTTECEMLSITHSRPAQALESGACCCARMRQDALCDLSR